MNRVVRVGRWLVRQGRRADLVLTLALLLLVAAVALPPFMLQRATFHYLVAFDITQSMNVEDVERDGAPLSRLAYARSAMRDALREMPCGSKIGWAVFADYRVMPLLLPVEVCSHYEELLASLDRIDGRMRWANASNIGKGMSWTIRTARAIDPNTRVVFFTDGRSRRRCATAPSCRRSRTSRPARWAAG
ncbi:hypothetical protein Y694_04494 [Methylibium sp. T29-B]|uniref:VWA domain-containing protein n=1 Tax=Methylibium sp. T29-B TaxID=1437443 RepID=UPI0003F3D06C|nr:VWA domain-containing protein [Methylibium sp. T29-B]EWS57524.1 hypothetical protein Y694_04494 [Methylibium sp. T29-B]